MQKEKIWDKVAAKISKNDLDGETDVFHSTHSSREGSAPVSAPKPYHTQHGGANNRVREIAEAVATYAASGEAAGRIVIDVN